MVKKIIISAAVVSALALGMVAWADTNGTAPAAGNSDASREHSQPTVLEITGTGKAMLRGTVDSVGSGSLTVKSWGGDWTINISSSTKLNPTDMSQFKAGDLVGIQGTVHQGANWTIDASLVRDWTVVGTVNQQEKQNKRETNQLMKSERPRTFAGTASNVTATSLTLTASNGTAYTVNISASAKLLNKKWGSVAASDIKSGDSLRVFGVNVNGIIAATVVRDTSL